VPTYVPPSANASCSCIRLGSGSSGDVRAAHINARCAFWICFAHFFMPPSLCRIRVHLLRDASYSRALSLHTASLTRCAHFTTRGCSLPYVGPSFAAGVACVRVGCGRAAARLQTFSVSTPGHSILSTFLLPSRCLYLPAAHFYSVPSGLCCAALPFTLPLSPVRTNGLLSIVVGFTCDTYQNGTGSDISSNLLPRGAPLLALLFLPAITDFCVVSLSSLYCGTHICAVACWCWQVLLAADVVAARGAFSHGSCPGCHYRRLCT